MDVAIQARFDATQALKDSDALFQKLSQVQALAANIKVNSALTGQITGIANATAILANAQLALQANINLTNNAATAAANALARMAAAQAALNVNTTQNISVTNNQNSALGALTNRILGLVASYVSLRSIMSLVHAAMDARIEMDRLEIGMKAITTDAEAAGSAVNFFTVETNRLGVNMRETIPEFVKMMASLTSSGMSFQDSERAFTNLSIATKAVGLSSAATGRILYDLQEMAALGTVQMRQLRQMLMQLPGALQAFSQAAGLTTAQFLEQVHKGMIDPSFIATKGLQALADKYAHEMPEAMDTLESHTNRLKNSWTQLLAEMGKSPAIKNVVDSANSVLTVATVVEKLNQLKSSTGHTWQQAGVQERAYMLRNAFPDAKEFGQPIDYTQATGFKGTESFQVPNYVNTYLRMQREQAWADSHKTAPEGPAAEKELTEAQMDAFDKIEDIRKRTEIEVLQGLQKEYAQIDANAKRQMEAIDKEQAKLGTAPGAQDAAARARLDVLVSANQAKKEALDKDNAANVQAYLEQVKQDSTDVANIMRDLIPDETERKIAEIDERFEKMRDHLQDIQDRSPNLLPSNWQDALDAARLKAESDVKQPKSASRYAGQDFNSLVAQRDQLKQSLLTQDDAEQFQKTAQQIQEISQQLVLQLHNDATSISEAFTFGFKEAVDSWGSLSERMAKVGNTLADSMSSHMTDALMGLIEGTKSAQQAFSEMAIAITEDLIKVAIEELIVKQIIAGVSAIGGAAGGAGGGETSGGTVSLDHAGGVAGESSRTAHVFGGFSRAPRFHGGGTIGDEVPIVARRGEVIFTPEQMKALTAGRGSGGPQKVEIANYTDPREIDMHIARNPHIIVNAIMSQRKKIQKVLS